MDFLTLPEQLQISIIDRLSPTDIMRSMRTCHFFRAIGKRASVWRRLRTEARQFNPRPYAKKYQTDFDVIMRMGGLCWTCWGELATVALQSRNICSKCYLKKK